MKLPNKIYDVLKWVSMCVLPGLGTLYFALTQIWGLPYGTEVVGTIAAINTFLGVLIGVSSTTYPGDGTLKVDTSDPSKDVYNLNLDIPIEDLSSKKTVTFKVDAK